MRYCNVIFRQISGPLRPPNVMEMCVTYAKSILMVHCHTEYWILPLDSCCHVVILVYLKNIQMSDVVEAGIHDR